MENELWRVKQQSRILQEFRGEIDPFWNDEAAKEMNLRYLNPHQDSDQRMLVNLREQNNNLNEAEFKLNSASKHGIQAERLSQLVAEQVEYTEQEMAVSLQFFEQYQEYLSITESLFPEIEDLIAQANSVCKGVPKE